MASGLIDTPCAHICPVDQHCPCVPGWGSLKVMTSTQQAARAAAQLHEAAQDVARVAARRGAQVKGHMVELPMQQVHELTEDPWGQSAGGVGRMRELEEKQTERNVNAIKDTRVGVLAATTAERML
jgi:hypothetical protein